MNLKLFLILIKLFFFEIRKILQSIIFKLGAKQNYLKYGKFDENVLGFIFRKLFE